MRVALHSVLREGAEAGYEAAHATIPEDLVESFDRLGIHDWVIWRSGRNLFQLVDCDDFGAAMRSLQSDPANQRWTEFISAYVDHFELPGHPPDEMAMPEVWQLARQRAGRTGPGG
jgi:L-rhamnose mutarotase